MNLFGIILALIGVLIIMYIIGGIIKVLYPPTTCPKDSSPIYPSIWAPSWMYGSYIRPIGCTPNII